jgi:hypothetical protein
VPELDIRAILGELDRERFEDLVALKEMAGRPEDIADLQRLRQARGEERP